MAPNDFIGEWRRRGMNCRLGVISKEFDKNRLRETIV